MTKFLTEHPFMKIVSLVLATMFWAILRGERRTEMSLDVPVQVKGVPEKFVISGEIDSTINLRLEGPKSRMDRIDRATFPPYPLDLSSGRKGPNTFWVHEGDFKIPSGVQVARVLPQVVRVTLDDAEEKLLRVEPRFVDEPDEGFEVESYEVTPAYTKKRASHRELAVLSYVYTEPISLAGRHASFVGDYALSGADNVAAPGEEKKVAVKVLIREKELSKIFRDVPVRAIGFRSAVRIEPRTVSIRVKGLAGKVAAFAEQHREIEIDSSRYGLSNTRQRVIRIKPVLPRKPGLELSVIPDTVQLTLLSE